MGGEQSSRATSLTLTFLFTDIESHAEKWDVHPAEMSVALRDHDALVVAAVSRVQGRVVKNEGDGAMAVFMDAARAVEAAVEIQRTLATREWPGVGRLRVRMGLNTGVAEARDDDYFGPEVIRAARVCAAASGGQILATRPVVELARGTTWIDLGQLPVDEQIALRRLSVFGGTFSLAAAEAVAGASADTVAALVDKSLVQRAEGGRFRLLETIRAYAEDRLLEAADGDAARGAHTTWLLQVIDSFSDDEVVLATTSRSDDFVSAELGNVYAGMAWATSTSDWPTVARVASYAGLAEGLIGRDSFRPVVRYIREALDQGIDGELRDRALAAYTAVAYLEAEVVREDLWAEVAQRAFRARDPLAVVQLTYLANVLDARSRDVGDQAGMAKAREAIDRATDIARGLGPQWVMLSTLFEVTLAMNASDWAHAADWVDTVRGLQDEGAVGRTSAWVLWVEAVALVAVGRPLPRVDIEARLANVRRQDAGVGAAVHVEALSAADPSHPRRPIDLDRSELDRATRADASAVLISTAALAARAGEWPLAARLLAGARGRGGIFSSPAGVALYRLIVPEVRAALDKPVRDQLLAEVRQLDVSSVHDLAAEWLAQPTA